MPTRRPTCGSPWPRSAVSARVTRSATPCTGRSRWRPSTRPSVMRSMGTPRTSSPCGRACTASAPWRLCWRAPSLGASSGRTDPSRVSDLTGPLRERALRAGSRIARPLPGGVGGMGIYFSAQQRLADDPHRTDSHQDVEAMLALADRSLDRGRIAASLRWYDKALRISYDSSLHQAGGSPLAADPEAFLRPLRGSETGTLMLDTPVPAASAPPRPAPREG